MNAVQIGALHKRFNSIGSLLDNVHQQVGLISMDLAGDPSTESDAYLALRASLDSALRDVEHAARKVDAAHHDFQLSLGEGG